MFDKKTNIAAQQAFGKAVNTGTLDAFFSDMRTAFPNLHVDVETLMVDDDQVAFAYTLTGTNDGPFQGNGPTGKAIKVRGLQIRRFADGKMIERWGSSDEPGIVAQLGLVQA